jgi:hypothetical protein
MVVCSEGNNGDWKYGILFSVLKKLEIKSAEVQHGALGIGMVYGSKLIEEHLFRAQKSDVLFTFGAYHSRRSNVADMNVALGNYKLEKTKEAESLKTRESSRIRIVMICEGIPPSAINNGLVTTVSEGLGQIKIPFEVIVRLHPTESENEKYDEILSLAYSRYSKYNEEDISELILNADVVIGHTSTVLFESWYYNKRPLILKDTNSVENQPEELGLWFSNADELRTIIEQGKYKEIDHNVRDDFWEQEGVVNNFRKFWKEKIQVSD